MHGGVDIDLLFPADTPASAELMWLKADCLYRAGVIDAGEWLVVHARCLAVLGGAAGGQSADAPREPAMTA